MSDSKKINVSDFDMKNLIALDVDMSEKGLLIQKEQFYSFLKYKNKSSDLLVKFGPTKFTEGAIPNLHEKFFPSDDKRLFLNYPNDPSQPECGHVFKMGRELDKEFSSDEFKKKLFAPLSDGMKKKMDKYVYSPIVKEVEDEMKRKFESLKIKLKTDFNTKELKTALYYNVDKLDKDGEPVKDEDGKVVKVPKKIPVKTVTDMHKYFNWNSTAQLVVRVAKVWMMKTPLGMDKKYLYGVTLEAIQIHVLEKHESKSSDEYEEFAFGSNDSVETIEKKTKKVVASDDEDDEAPVVEKKKASKQTDDDEDDEEDSDKDVKEADSEEDAEVEEQPVKNSKGKGKKKKIVSESDEESEEDVKPRKTHTKHAKK